MLNASSASTRLPRQDAFKESVVLMTGGTSGIGAAISLAFSEVGALVTATGISREEVSAFQFGGTTQQLDVTNMGEVAVLLKVSRGSIILSTAPASYGAVRNLALMRSRR